MASAYPWAVGLIPPEWMDHFTPSATSHRKPRPEAIESVQEAEIKTSISSGITGIFSKREIPDNTSLAGWSLLNQQLWQQFQKVRTKVPLMEMMWQFMMNVQQQQKLPM
jgi:hypothetical protein